MPGVCCPRVELTVWGRSGVGGVMIVVRLRVRVRAKVRVGVKVGGRARVRERTQRCFGWAGGTHYPATPARAHCSAGRAGSPHPHSTEAHALHTHYPATPARAHCSAGRAGSPRPRSTCSTEAHALHTHMLSCTPMLRRVSKEARKAGQPEVSWVRACRAAPCTAHSPG